MAEEKKSFILYVDLIHTIEKLPNEDAGELFKHILRYVNDKNPTTENILVDVTFEPIKQQLKRDLKAWEGSKEEKSIAGIKGNLKRWNSDLYEQVVSKKITLEEAQSIAERRRTSQPDKVPSQGVAKIAVNDNVNVNVNVNDIKKEIIKEKVDVDKSTTSKTLQERQIEFGKKVKSYSNKYPSDMLKDFFNYWTEKNENGKKMRFEMQKVFDIKRRLATWHNRTPNTTKPIMDDLVKNVYKQIGYDIK
jgi:hypothetical protein